MWSVHKQLLSDSSASHTKDGESFFFQAFFSQLFAFFLFEAINLEHSIKKTFLSWIDYKPGRAFSTAPLVENHFPGLRLHFPPQHWRKVTSSATKMSVIQHFALWNQVLLRTSPLQYSNSYCRPPQTPPECRPVPELTSSSEASASSRRRWSRRKVQRRRSSPCLTQWSRSDQRAYRSVPPVFNLSVVQLLVKYARNCE